MGQDVEGMGCGERIICLCLTVCFGIAVFSTVDLWRPWWWYFHCQNNRNRLSQWRWCSWSCWCWWYRWWRWQRPRWGSSTWRRSSTARPRRSCRPALRRRRWCAPACTQRRWLLVEIWKYVCGDCCTCGDFHICGEYYTCGNYHICHHYYIFCDVNVDEDSDKEEPIKFGISSMLAILMVTFMLLAIMVPLMMIVMILK